MTMLDRKKMAVKYIRRAFEAQSHGDWEGAVEMYQLAISSFPTPEALTFMGWALSFLGKFEEAIAVCQRAIELDPAFGNPYNDIGAYLIELNRYDEAVPYLEKAVKAVRNESPHFSYYNLGRVREKQGQIRKAMVAYQRAVEEDSQYHPPRQALERLKYLLN